MRASRLGQQRRQLRRDPLPQRERPADDPQRASIAAAEDPEDLFDATAAWRIWRERLASFAFHTGSAWRGIDRYGTRPRSTRLTTKHLDLIVARRAAAAELPGNWGGHSLRRGFATSALAAGASERAVREHGRWRSAAAMAPYIDEAEGFADTNPSRYLGRRPTRRRGQEATGSPLRGSR